MTIVTPETCIRSGSDRTGAEIEMFAAGASAIRENSLTDKTLPCEAALDYRSLSRYHQVPTDSPGRAERQ